jgi:hypothetical protein
MSENKKELSEEEYLKKHLDSVDNQNQNKEQQYQNTDIPFVKPVVESAKSSDLHFFNFDVKEMPCGVYYPTGTIVMVRPAQVKEIQSYSMVDDSNFYDIVEKMNDMLQSCVRLKYPDGKVSSFMDIKDQDRLFLIFLIRELTFQQGNSLAVAARCSCGDEMQIEMNRNNFSFHEFDEKLSKYFDNSTKSYHFNVQNGRNYELSPPCIGIQKSFTDYIIKENNEKKSPNLAFLKIIPFMLTGRSSITIEGIKSKLQEFEKIDDISFQFLNAAVGKMTFGLKELKSTCISCGLEVRSDMTFPNGASGIFVIHDAFEAYIKE